ncbi:Hypothetical predicted protein [Marmota monax]|uniref:Uncharacterized protein n=1 Tax=Marmota monax TaxID=9995 RepID=A0A5E4B289_MARMO|nr:hypothetical protein GHT09_002293 [Marmota monax]VTJ62752.1 Hypothetical predicted protein [Marmota monax]
MGGVGEEVEPPGRGGAAGAEPSLPPPPLRCLSVGGDTKSSRSVPSAWRRCPTGDAEGGRAGGAPPEGPGGELGCRRRRRAARAAPQPAAGGAGGRRPAACVWLSGAGAPGPPSDAAAAGVASARARCGERNEHAHEC